MERILSFLHVAEEPNDVDLPGFHLHTLRGDSNGFWRITVSRNHRIVFRFCGKHVHDVNFVDYH